ncbi:hypothetical protein ASG14_13310 [Pedobacter sp. Leaf194]|nr:hypothetical protein ASG14_13310 [Pedobacter sp. Leaf194]
MTVPGKQAGLGTTGTGFPKPDGSGNPFWLHETFTSSNTRSPKRLQQTAGLQYLWKTTTLLPKNFNKMFLSSTQ